MQQTAVGGRKSTTTFAAGQTWKDAGNATAMGKALDGHDDDDDQGQDKDDNRKLLICLSTQWL